MLPHRLSPSDALSDLAFRIIANHFESFQIIANHVEAFRIIPNHFETFFEAFFALCRIMSNHVESF